MGVWTRLFLANARLECTFNIRCKILNFHVKDNNSNEFLPHDNAGGILSHICRRQLSHCRLLNETFCTLHTWHRPPAGPILSVPWRPTKKMCCPWIWRGNAPWTRPPQRSCRNRACHLYFAPTHLHRGRMPAVAPLLCCPEQLGSPRPPTSSFLNCSTHFRQPVNWEENILYYSINHKRLYTLNVKVLNNVGWSFCIIVVSWLIDKSHWLRFSYLLLAILGILRNHLSVIVNYLWISETYTVSVFSP